MFDESKRRGELRVITHNLWGMRGDWKARRAVLKSGLDEAKADLIAFQEVILNDSADQVAELLGSGYHVVQQTDREPDGQGIAIASHWPVRAVHEVDLNVSPRTADFACGALIAEIDAPDPIGPMLFANHLPNWQPAFELERQLQAVKVARVIEDLLGGANLPVILAGDLDADPDAGSIRFWTGRDVLDGMSVCYLDAWQQMHPDEPGDTFGPASPLADRVWPFRRIDYILLRWHINSSPLTITGCERIFDQPVDGIWASDHFGVMADFAGHDSSLLT